LYFGKTGVPDGCEVFPTTAAGSSDQESSNKMSSDGGETSIGDGGDGSSTDSETSISDGGDGTSAGDGASVGDSSDGGDGADDEEQESVAYNKHSRELLMIVGLAALFTLF
jgi:hypothetical protein